MSEEIYEAAVNFITKVSGDMFEKVPYVLTSDKVEDNIKSLQALGNEVVESYRKEFGFDELEVIVTNETKHFYNVVITSPQFLKYGLENFGFEVAYTDDMEFFRAQIVGQIYIDDKEKFRILVASNKGKHIEFEVEGADNAEDVMYLLRKGIEYDIEEMMEDEKLEAEDEEDDEE